jgi:hypothetical protein
MHLCGCLVIALILCGGCRSSEEADGPLTDASASCPASQPGQNNLCDSIGQTCAYASTNCTCYSELGGSGTQGEWACNPTACPLAQPGEGTSCALVTGQNCLYGFERFCRCVGPEGVWSCCGGIVSTCDGARAGAICCGGSHCSGDAGELDCDGAHWR